MALLLPIQNNHHAGTPAIYKLGYSSNCYIGSKIEWVSMKEVYKYGAYLPVPLLVVFVIHTTVYLTFVTK